MRRSPLPGLSRPASLYPIRGVQWTRVFELISSADLGRLSVAAALASLALFVRACRWRLLLMAEGPVDVASSFWATAAGYLGNNVLPARGGELVRTFLVASGTSLDRAFVLATALAERAVDAFLLVAVAGVTLQRLPASPPWVGAAARTFTLVGVVGITIIAVLPFLGRPLLRLTGRLPLPRTTRTRVGRVVEHGLRGLRAFHTVQRLGSFVALSAAIWLVDISSVMVGASALGLRMSGAAALLLIAGLGLGSALPSTPGNVGIYQFVAVTVLPPFGFTRDAAIVYIVVAQAVSYVVIGLWGGVGLLQDPRAAVGVGRRKRSPGWLPVGAGQSGRLDPI